MLTVNFAVTQYNNLVLFQGSEMAVEAPYTYGTVPTVHCTDIYEV